MKYQVRYMVPVYVDVEDGEVQRVTVDDESIGVPVEFSPDNLEVRLDYDRLERSNPEWPAWRFGW